MPGPTLGACSHFHAREVCTSCRLGDPHSLAPSWHRVVVCGEQRLLMPALVTGLKAWHIRPSSTFYPKRNYEAVRSPVLYHEGRLSCRCSLGCGKRCPPIGKLEPGRASDAAQAQAAMPAASWAPAAASALPSSSTTFSTPGHTDFCALTKARGETQAPSAPARRSFMPNK